jgi:hypothetical protein
VVEKGELTWASVSWTLVTRFDAQDQLVVVLVAAKDGVETMTWKNHPQDSRRDSIHATWLRPAQFAPACFCKPKTINNDEDDW